MPTLVELTPAERARLLGKPEGELGVVLGKVMNENNAQVIEAAYRRLGLQTGHSVLEIGFGNGHTVPLLMNQAEALNYVGIDISETMVAEATSFNQPLIDAGRAAFHFAAAGSLPCADASVDRAVAVNVIYFWPDPVHELSEIRRVLRPDGMSVIAATDAVSAAAYPFARAEFGFHARDADALIALHRQAGFSAVTVEPFDDMGRRPDGTTFARHYHFVVARL